MFNVGNGLKFRWEKYFGSEMTLRYRKTPELTKIRKIKNVPKNVPKHVNNTGKKFQANRNTFTINENVI